LFPFYFTSFSFFEYKTYQLEKEVKLKPTDRKGLKVLERGDAQNQIPLSRAKI